jgi:hypothetical protein
VASTGTLLTRARQEQTSAQAALQELEGYQRCEHVKLERAIRAGNPPPAPQPSGLDRAAIVARVAATEAIVGKLAAEDQAARSRMGEAVAAIRQAAIQYLGALFDRDVEQLRELETIDMTYRSTLRRVAEFWPDHRGPLPLSEATASYIAVPPDQEAARYLTSPAVVAPWKQLLEQLLTDPDADFATVSNESVSEAAE